MLNRNIFISAGLVIVVFAALLWGYSPRGTSNVRYEVQSNMSIPLHKSDTIRVAESYERMMDRYISTLEYRIASVDNNMSQVNEKLNSIDKKIDDIAFRLSRIEKALNITDEIPKPQDPPTDPQPK